MKQYTKKIFYTIAFDSFPKNFIIPNDVDQRRHKDIYAQDSDVDMNKKKN